MGLFSKRKGEAKEVAQPTKGLNDLLELDLQDGDFTLPEKLWGHLTRYIYRAADNNLRLHGSKYFKVQDVSQMINEFAAKFGIDGHGEGNWTSRDTEDLESYGNIFRTWYFDKNFNKKPAEWVTDDSNNYDYARMIRIDCDKNDDEVGVELQFTGWTEIKEYLIK